MNIKVICHRFIHSYYLFILSDKYNKSVIVTSDYYKTKELLIIDIDKIIYIFREFGENYPTKMKIKYDEKGNIKISVK